MALDTAQIASIFRAEFEATQAPGASIAIVHGDRIVFSRALGVRNIETGDPMTTGSLVRIGSITKSFTGLMAALLASDKTVDVAAPVARYSPEISRAIGTRTLHQLLTHTGGVVDEGASNGSHDDAALGNRVKQWTAAQLFAEAGDVYSYSSPGYWLSGYVLQQATKTPYADLVHTRLLTPLGMTSSTYRPLDALTRELAVDHRVAQGRATVLRPFQDDASTWPSGSLFSSAADLSRYATVLMNDGTLDGKRVLPASVVHAMLTTQHTVPNSPCGYSYGFSICVRDGLRTVSHYGFRVGSGAVLSMMPDQRIAVIILANRNGAIFRRTEMEVLRQVRAATPQQPDAQRAETPAAKPAPAHNARFVGTWVNGGISLEIVQRSDSLFYRYGGTDQRARLASPAVLHVLDDTGNPVQQFELVAGLRTRRAFLTDGMSAFARKTR
jgi:CubicO group peptidase (beta-lactamase class C family)